MAACPPLIGVCAMLGRARWSSWDQPVALVPDAYLGKLRDAGGVPVGLLPDPRATERPEVLLSRVDGLLLLGGADVDPSFYGAPANGCEATTPERDRFEIALAQSALEADLPVLGVCRGMQVLTVATGGTLHQDLVHAGYAEHRVAPGRLDATTMHPVEVSGGSLAAEMAGAGVQTVNSHHHQGVRELGAGAVVTARAVPDGLVEAVEWSSHTYVLGVQWHPESEHLDHAVNQFVRAAADRVRP